MAKRINQGEGGGSGSDRRESDHARWVRESLATYEGPLTRYAARLTGNVETARDVVQEAFLRLCRENAARLDGRLPEWLYTVCRNRALDVRRKERRIMPLADSIAESTASAERPPPQLVADAEQSSEVLRHLATLPEAQQEVVHLRFSGGLSYRQISEVTSLSVSNVGFLLHTAIKALRERLRVAGRLADGS